MSSIRDAIVATLAYYNVFDYPLTGFEVWQNLINPVRLERNPTAIGVVTLSLVLIELSDLTHSGRIGEHNGFYFLSGREDIYDTRLERQKISARKWKKLINRAKWFQAVPYIRAMFVSGSMAMDNTKESGDFDIFLVVQAGRLYIVRLWVSIIAWLLRSLRVKTDESAPDKFCFNHYITTDGLELSSQSIYTAHALAHLIPIFVRGNTDQAFWASNRWINKYFYNFMPGLQTIKRSPKYFGLFDIVCSVRELILNQFYGQWLEKFVKTFQQKRIWRNPARFRQDGRIVATDTQLEFHPHSFEKVVLKNYNESLKNLGFSLLIPERDSGLA